MTRSLSGDELLIKACQLLTDIAASDPAVNDFVINNYTSIKAAAKSVPDTPQTSLQLIQNNQAISAENAKLNAKLTHLMDQISDITTRSANDATAEQIMSALRALDLTPEAAPEERDNNNNHDNDILAGFSRLPISHHTLALVTDELARQKEKWGDGHIQNQTTAGHALILKKLVDQVALSWVNCGEGRDSVGANLVKLAATALVAIEKECGPTPFQSG